MAKDPAFLFYPGDWLGGTMLMTRLQKGCYIDVLMAQFNNGPLSIDQIKSLLGDDFCCWAAIEGKFKKNEKGLFFNEKLATEIEKRKDYVKSRSNNRARKNQPKSVSYENHMMQHNKNINETQQIEKKPDESNFYPKNNKNPVFVPKNKENDDICFSYENHMMQHMENENENENKDSKVLLEEIGGMGEKEGRRGKEECRFRDRGGGGGENTKTQNVENDHYDPDTDEKLFLIPRMQKLWIDNFPNYTADRRIDFEALGSIMTFMFSQNGNHDPTDLETQEMALNTLQAVAHEVKNDPFWVNKPLRSIANNIQEFYNKIKNPQNVKSSRKSKPNAESLQQAIDRRLRKQNGSYDSVS